MVARHRVDAIERHLRGGGQLVHEGLDLLVLCPSTQSVPGSKAIDVVNNQLPPGCPTQYFRVAYSVGHAELRHGRTPYEYWKEQEGLTAGRESSDIENPYRDQAVKLAEAAAEALVMIQTLDIKGARDRLGAVLKEIEQ